MVNKFNKTEKSSSSTNKTFVYPDLPIVCVMGLGFVGAAMAVAVAEASDNKQKPFFNVVGLDLPNDRGRLVIDSINRGVFPAETNDLELKAAIRRSHERGNLIATCDTSVLEKAYVVVIDINLDLGPKDEEGEYTVNFEGFTKAIETVGNKIQKDCLILVETTVPPGTCAHIVFPKLKECFESRGFSGSDLMVAHSYERVMPGDNYLFSIINFWRVYSGLTEKSADFCAQFLEKIVNTKEHPMIRLANTTASETAKVLENSYRAINIALIEEWARFAENVGVDLFSVINAIRMRPTHNNIRQPGFGVGGYCLTKDPLFARAAAKNIFNRPDLEFPFSQMAVEVNNFMPKVSVQTLLSLLDKDLKKRTILLLGVSYRPDVADTRSSASEVFVTEIEKHGIKVLLHDPLVDHWDELDVTVASEFPLPNQIDALVFAVSHGLYKDFDFVGWLGDNKPIVLDTNNVLSDEQIESFKEHGCRVRSIGRGEL